MANKAKWNQFVALKTACVPNKEIVKRLNVGRKTVKNAWNQFQESGTTSGKQIPDRMRTVRTKSIISATKKKVERNPQRSVKKLQNILESQYIQYDGSKQLISELSKQKYLSGDKLMLR